MYSINTAVGAERIREWHEQAARDRLVIEARRARREAAQARPRRRGGTAGTAGPRWWARRPAPGVPAQRVPADATPDQWASALSMAGAAERAGADDREPVGGRAS